MTFTWSAENRLTGYSVGGGGPTVSLDYDAGGRLSRRISSAIGTNYYLWEGANLVAELDGAGTKAAEYSYYGLDRLHEVTVGTTTYNAHQDAQGNVLALTDANRNLARTYNYEDFGRAAGGTDYVGFNSHDRARWKGALWMGPELELYYMRNRWYEPQSGRFLSEDPIGLAGGINPYAFAGGDPINGWDPFGLDPCQDHSGNDHYDEPPPDTTPPPPGQVGAITTTYHDCSEYRRERDEALHAWESSRQGPVFFGGLQGCNTAGVGMCGAAGGYLVPGAGGLYAQGSVSGGVDVSVGVEFGFFTSQSAFEGASREWCGSVAVASFCIARANSGWGVSFGIGFGLTPASARYGEVYTTVSQPRPVAPCTRVAGCR